jgi:hypothetical protein
MFILFIVVARRVVLSHLDCPKEYRVYEMNSAECEMSNSVVWWVLKPSSEYASIPCFELGQILDVQLV